MGETAEQLKADIEYRRERMSGTVDAIEDRVVPGRIIQRRRESARNWMGQARARVMGPPQRLADQVAAAPDQVAAGAHHLAEDVAGLPGQVTEQTRGAPLVAGGVAFGLGAMVALLLPETRPERQAAARLEPQISAITDAAKETAQQTASSVMESAQQAATEVKQTATEHATQAGDQARDAAEQVAATAKHEAPGNTIP
jgi:hypothetical protein